MLNFIFILFIGFTSFAQQEPQSFNLNAMTTEEIKKAQSDNQFNEQQNQQIETFLKLRELQEKIGVTPEHLQKVQLFLDKWLYKYKDKILLITTDKKVSDALKNILENGNFKLYIVLQVLLIFFMIFLRAREATKVSGVLSWLWLNTWTFIVFMSIGIFIIPLISFGAAYKDLLWGIYEASKTTL